MNCLQRLILFISVGYSKEENPVKAGIMLSYSFFISLSSVQSLRHVQLLATPWTAAHQASLSFTISWSLLKLISIESVMPSSYLILCHPLLFLPSIFPSGLFASGGQSIGASTSASVLPMTMQVRFPLGLTFLISLLSQGLSRVFSNITVQRHHFFSTQPFSLSSSHIHI